MRSNLPDKNYFVNKAIPERPDVVIIEWKESGNDAHLFRSHSNILHRDLACKIIPRSNLNLLQDSDGRELWQKEIHKADALKSTTVVKFEGIREWKDDAAGIDCVVLISEFVEGPSLRNFMLESSDSIDVSFIVEWLKTMLNLFNEMKIRGITHGDIHSGNILVEDRSSYDLVGPKYVFRVTDFGVADATSEPRFKDDYLQLADILKQLLSKVKYTPHSPKDKFIFTILRDHFADRHLVESDLTRDYLARQPAELLSRLFALDIEFEKNAAQESSLLTPFDFLSCEQIGDSPTLLRALYSDRFLGLSEIESQNNVVITGPRGCGKTTVFRSLSLDQKLHVDDTHPDHMRYIGVYYRCIDLYFAFPRYKRPAREEALDIPIHFITATLLGKLLDLLYTWARKSFVEEFTRAESKVVENIWNIMGIDPPQLPGHTTLKAVIARLNKERSKAAERQRFVNDQNRAIGQCFGPEVLLKACEVLNSHFSFVRGRPIYFFIDDYSSPKVTKDLQENLNRVFMQRVSTCFFKLSTESPASFSKSDVDGKIYVEGREFVLQNLGLVYLHAELDPKLTFIDDVFRRRLSESKTTLPATNLEELVGSRPLNNNDVARQIRENKRTPFWGKEIICHLCSGDIHYLISLVGDMVAKSGGPQGLTRAKNSFKIERETQNRAIREGAGNFLKNLRGIPKYGEHLISVVEAFGSVANSQLKYLDSKNEEGLPPKQATRIEPYEPFSLSPTAQQLYDELLRYSVFIEDFRGKSRRGKVVPRLFLRRFLIPHFNLTFSTRDSIELEPEEFEEFIMTPKTFENKLRLKSLEDARRFVKKEENSGKQLPLQLTQDDESGSQNP